MAYNEYLVSWYNGAVSDVSNDAEYLNLDEVVEISTVVKFMIFFGVLLTV